MSATDSLANCQHAAWITFLLQFLLLFVRALVLALLNTLWNLFFLDGSLYGSTVSRARGDLHC